MHGRDKFRTALMVATLGATLASTPFVPAIAADASWQEKAIGEHLDIADFAGTLDKPRFDRLVKAGESLFGAKFTPADGVGRPLATQAITPVKRKRPARDAFNRTAGMDANACSSCHNVPKMGGAGDFSANVFVSEGFTNADFDSLDPQFSNERNTNHVFGSGLIELLAREMTAELHAMRREAVEQARSSAKRVEVRLVTKGVDFGKLFVDPDGMIDLSALDGIDTDLVIRPFSHKGVMTSLRQFTVNALNHHHGIQAVERFGARWTGEQDFDEDGKPDELSEGDVSALVAWQASLQPPSIKEPAETDWRKAASEGSRLFDQIGCTSCHVRQLPLSSLDFSDPGPFDAAGTLRASDVANPTRYHLALAGWAQTLQKDSDGNWLVPLFGDLKRHRIADPRNAAFGNELLAQRFVDRDVFQTTELWGIASTAPYGHRGDMVTLDQAIRAHGGDAAPVTAAYIALPDDERSALIAFLKTLVIE
ncbi:MAG: di-heme oxidoredictase family protein [Rhizobiaceae bacterium]